MPETLARSTIVVDVNVAVWAILPITAKVDTLPLFVRWRQQQIRLVAPALWLGECVSTIRQLIYARRATLDEGLIAIDSLFNLAVESFPLDRRLSVAALRWAARLQQGQAYDGFYLALAEDLGADFWTADRHVANAARQSGVSWVQLIE
jgi:predicted nucleic acid-binding protein